MWLDRLVVEDGINDSVGFSFGRSDLVFVMAVVTSYCFLGLMMLMNWGLESGILVNGLRFLSSSAYFNLLILFSYCGQTATCE